MTDIINEICSTEVTVLNSIFKILLSLLLGTLIGLERRQHGQTAGMRTFALISMGATLAMIISYYIPQEFNLGKVGDPGRVAAQVISGIGFLGAGAIIHMKGDVRGLTTAAGIWITACVGLAVGCGMFLIASVATILIIVVLLLVSKLEYFFFRGTQAKIVRVKVHSIITDLDPYREAFRKNNVDITSEYLRYDYDSSITIINYIVRSVYGADFVKVFADIHSLGDVASITLSNEVNN